MENITGSTFFNPELCAKRLELIKEAVPPTIRVGVLLNPDNPIHLPCLQQMERTAKSINLELVPFQVHSPNEFESAFLAWDTKHVNAMTVIEDAMLIANSKRLLNSSQSADFPRLLFGMCLAGQTLSRHANHDNSRMRQKMSLH